MSRFITSRWPKALSPIGLACIALLFLISSSPVHAQKTTTKDKAVGSAKKAAGSATKKATGTAGSSIKVGEKFPAVKLNDQAGKPFDLSATLKKGPVALVIFRSADW